MKKPYQTAIRILATLSLLLSIWLIRSTVSTLSDQMPSILPIMAGLLNVVRFICIIFIFVDKKIAGICLLVTCLLFIVNALLLTHHLNIAAFISDLLLGILAILSVRKTVSQDISAKD